MTDRAIPSNANLAFILATLPRDLDELSAPASSSRAGVDELTDAVVHLGELALAFGRIDRTACYHPFPRADGTWRKETDTDHTVMLGWLSCAIASRFFPDLNIGLVAQIALVHDAVEIYAGDTQTLRISQEERAAKKDRETEAATRLGEEFMQELPWFPELIFTYEQQDTPEARFVRALDKSLPKIVHLLDQLHGLREFGIMLDELAQMLTDQTASIATYAGEFRELAWIRSELTRRLLTHPRWQANGYVAE